MSPASAPTSSSSSSLAFSCFLLLARGHEAVKGPPRLGVVTRASGNARHWSDAGSKGPWNGSQRCWEPQRLRILLPSVRCDLFSPFFLFSPLRPPLFLFQSLFLPCFFPPPPVLLFLPGSLSLSLCSFFQFFPASLLPPFAFLSFGRWFCSKQRGDTWLADCLQTGTRLFHCFRRLHSVRAISFRFTGWSPHTHARCFE